MLIARTTRQVAGAQGHCSSAMLCHTAAGSPMQCLDDGFRIARGDAKQRERGPVWGPASLLPIPERRHAHTNHQRELHLGLTKVAAQRLHIRRPERGSPRRLSTPPADLAGLTDAL